MANFKKVILFQLVVWALVWLIFPPLVKAGCGHFFHHQKVVAVPVAVPVALYQVGSDLEIKAAVEKALRQREAAAFQQQQQAVRNVQQQEWEAERKPTQAPGVTVSNLAPGNYPTIQAKCGRCHAQDNSSAGSYFSITNGIDAEMFFTITDMVANKTIHKGGVDQPLPPTMDPVLKGLKPEEYGKLLDEFIRMKKATAARPVTASAGGY